MSIRPVDYTSLIPKSQEISKTRQIENDKFNNQTEIAVVQQQKQIKKNLTKVRDMNKAENLTINTNKRNKKGKKNEDNRDGKKKREKDKNNVKDKETLGRNIDIRI